MRAVIVRQPGPFATAAQVEVVPDPQPGTGQVVVDLHAIEVNFPDILVKNITVSGLQWSDYRERAPERVRHAQEALFAHHVQGRLKPLIAATYPLDRFAEALARFGERTVQGKLILEPR
jgi:NADPH:quinone reductase-like Zn-dependent oxidoreductase